MNRRNQMRNQPAGFSLRWEPAWRNTPISNTDRISRITKPDPRFDQTWKSAESELME